MDKGRAGRERKTGMVGKKERNIIFNNAYILFMVIMASDIW